MIIPGSEVPVPDRRDGYRYGEVHAQQLAETMQALHERHAAWECDQTVPAATGRVIGHGHFSTVREVGNDEGVFAYREPLLPSNVVWYAQELVRGVGCPVPGLEQLVAVGGLGTYAEILPGKSRIGGPGEALTAADIAQITKDQLNQMLDLVTVMQARGLRLDLIGDNVLLSNEHGFGLVDYGIAPIQGVDSKVCGFTCRIMAGRVSLTNHGADMMRREEAQLRLEPIALVRSLVHHRATYAPDFWGPATDVVDPLYESVNRIAQRRVFTA